jgi:DNA-binding response OmpR family regulator
MASTVVSHMNVQRSEAVRSPAPAARVLVVEDDATVAEVVGRYLDREGYLVETLADGAAALERALASPPDVIVLDIMLPGMDGLEVCRRVRSAASIPIIMLTARGQETDRVLGLELGADDYVAKPFSPRELTARVKAVLRRSHSVHDGTPSEAVEILRAGDLEVDVAAREVRVAGDRISLTAREFDLLAFLMAHPHRVFRREQLLEHVWGYTFGDTATVTVHVRRLREKVEHDAAAPTHIRTVWGVGYRFEP